MPATAPHKHFVTNQNPLRFDPTRTTGLQLQYVRLIRSRLRWLIARIKFFIDTEDALALRNKTTFVRMQERQYEFQTDETKLRAFNEWLEEQIQQGVLNFQDQNKKLIESAYKRGLSNAFASSKQAKLASDLGVGDQTKEQFLRTAFATPENINKIRFLATRSFEQMKGITAPIASKMNFILAKGLAEGRNPRDIAREMANAIGTLSRTRAEVIAKTELVAAHASGQLDAFRDLGVEELGVRAEWVTAGDARVCTICASMEGKTFTLEEAEGLIPRHAQCRCVWEPATK